MENRELAEYVDQQRWLLNNGLISDDVKNQLFFCGSIVHKDVQAVEVDIVPDERLIKYLLYFDKKTLKKVEKYHRLSKSTGIIGMWQFKRFLQKEGTLDFRNMLNRFVRDYCGPKWSTEVTIKDFDTYLEELGAQGENHGGSQPADQLPD
jgi:hypothetical protein